MVQLLPTSPYSHNGATVPQTPEEWRASLARSDHKTTKEEHAQRVRDLNTKRGFVRAPRRGWSMTDYQGEHAAHLHSQPATSVAVIPEDEAVPTTKEPTPTTTPAPTQENMVLPQRPKLPPPRRSYSVTDHEPIPINQPKPSSRLGLIDLPSELHYNLFDFLDPIDGACLGLAHSKLYDIHRRKNGKVPLSSRYSGPNDMEWAWRGAGPLVRPSPSNVSVKEKDLEQLRVKGQVYCRKCGIHRCELRRHLKEWMGPGYEYCEIKEAFGNPASEDAKSYCYMSSPNNPHRCGRHGAKKIAAAAA